MAAPPDDIHSTAQVRLDSSHPAADGWAAPFRRSQVVLRCDASGCAALQSRRDVVRRWDDPLETLRWLECDARANPGSRWIGYLSYELGRRFEDVPARSPDDLGLPLFAFAKFEDDRDQISPQAASTRSPQAGSTALATGQHSALFSSTFTRPQYLAAVSRAIDYIRAGDIFQVNLSQRFTAPLADDPIDIYRRLLAAAPARYGGYLDFGDFALLSNSPELFLRVTRDPATGRRLVATRPIKGTRPRRPGMDRELLASAKDQAELNMIVDLERNDLGRVCEIGSVRVAEPRTIETHPTVYHGAAQVEGVLREDVGLVELLGATFPGGSITGAPKIRAMQIIDELEPVRRGPYCGAIGSIGADRMDFNVSIRTMIVRAGRIHVPAGGGVVADSDPAAEYDETLVKAQAMLQALLPPGAG